MNLVVFKEKAKYVGYLLVLGSVYFLGDVFVENIGSLKGFALSPTNLGILSVPIIFHFAGNGFAAYAWVEQLNGKYPAFSLNRAYCIIGMSQVYKYLPGNIGHFVARMVLIPADMRKADVAFTLFVETVMLTATAGFLGIFYIFYFDYFAEFGTTRLVGTGLAGLLGLIAVFAGVNFLRKKYDLLALARTVYLKIFTCFTANFLMGGLSILLLLSMIDDPSAVTYLQCVTGFALSFMAGFIVPGAPGGIGIREFTFVILFGNFVTDSVALEVILLFRIMNMVGDILLFAYSWLQARKLNTCTENQ